MPIMIRPEGKAKKIAYKILGVPDNMQSKYTQHQLKIRKRLLFEANQKVK